MFYEEIDIELRKQILKNEELEIMIMGILEGLYPNYPWLCTIQDGETKRGKFKYAYIFNGYITSTSSNNGTAGISMSLAKYKSFDEIYNFLKKNGGEMLERANLPRVGKQEYIDGFIAQAEKDFGRKQGLLANFDES